MTFSVGDAARAAGDSPALIIDGATLLYRDLARSIEPVRANLRALTARSAGPVAIRVAPQRATLMAIYALLEEGIPFVPLHPRLAANEAAKLATDLQVSMVLDEAALSDLAHEPSSSTSSGENRPNDDRTLAIVFTSGTSGKSRGAILQRSAFAASARGSARNLPWRPNDRWLLCMPLAHVGGLSIVTRCLEGRQAVVFHPKFDVAAVLASIVTDGITRVSLVPTMLFDLLAQDRDNHLALLDTVLLGGAATAPALLEECARRGIRALTTYGLTEACSQVTTQAPRAPEILERGSGRPLDGVDLQISTGAGERCKLGEIGSIYIRGPALMRGYVGEAPLGDAYFDTGDLGSIDESGALHLASRKKDLIITGGENVYPLEVESAFMECDGVEAVVVFGVPDARWGEQVSAVISGGARYDEARVKNQLRKTLAVFKIPKAIVVVNELPKSEGGKIARAEVVRTFTSQLRRW